MLEKNICCRFALGVTSLTRHSAPSTNKKTIIKILDCQIITVISVLGHLYIVYTSVELK